jgi:4-alpha-glucanotransferase
LIITPHRLTLPEGVDADRAWGLMTQLYQLRSDLSWGLGDLADLGELAVWGARRHGADFVLVNPLHAAQPVAPMEPSPYLPTTRRFANPIYLRVEDIRELAYLASTDRALVEWQAEEVRMLNADPGQLDRDAVWAAKQSALETIYAHPRTPARQAAFEDFKEREGEGLLDFATWCAFAERFGLPATKWPEFAQSHTSAGTVSLREEIAERVDFHRWLQWCLDEQLHAAQQQALDAGMRIGLMHDLAVGVHPEGADVWALGDALAASVSVGAPPDAFNQQGQNWSQPPWRPDRLAATGYEPFRAMIRTVLRSCGALRVDHILGLFRLWWVPKGVPASSGTYVRYDHEAMVGVLCLEAQRAGAFVIGEDLGTVEPWVRDYLSDRGILGTSILWFERENEGRPIQPERWRRLCLATVTTHDLPPTAGYLAGEHIAVRDRLGLLTRPVAEEKAADDADRASVLQLLADRGLVGPSPNEQEIVEGLHRFLTWTPARLIGVQVADLIGDRRAINQPGTSDEYPNWRLPLTDSDGDPVLLSDLLASPRAAALIRASGGR